MAERRFVTTTGSEKALDDLVLDKLGGRLRGALVRPGDPDYDRVRKVWNGMIDKRPALIARCAGAADVDGSASASRGEHDLLVSRSAAAATTYAGNAVCDGGLMIDLSPMKGVRVDPAPANRVGPQAGLRLGRVRSRDAGVRPRDHRRRRSPPPASRA